MFGLFRIYLALAVMADHLLRVPEFGRAAVFSFFTLSGFLMTMIMARSYGYGLAGFASFAANRFLRLFPAYWIALLLTLLIIVATGESKAHELSKALSIPHTAWSWAMNLTMAFPSLYPVQLSPRLFPIVWTLTIELFYYVLIGLGLTRSRTGTILFLALGLAYHLFGLMAGQALDPRLRLDFHYHSIFAAALPFAAGAIVYHYREVLGRLLARRAAALLLLHMATLATAAAAFVAVRLIYGRSAEAQLTVDLATLAAAVVVSAPVIAALYRPQEFPVSPALDALLGKFSYPVYLLHLQVSLFMSWLLFGRYVQGPALFAASLLPVAALSWAIIRFVEPLFDTIRERVKRDRRAARQEPIEPAISPASVTHA